MSRSLSRYLALALLAGASLNAQAAGYQIYQGLANMSNAFAGEGAVTEDATIVFNNPAATVFLDGLTITLPVKEALVSPDTTVAESVIDTPVETIVTGNKREIGGSWNLIPAALASYTFMDHKWAVGLGITSPFGLVSDFTNAFQGRYLATHSRLTVINVGPTIAWQPFPCFSIGAGFDAQYVDADVRQRIWTELVPLPYDGNLITEVNGWGYGWNAGLFYHIAQTHTNLGLTYRSRIKHDPHGHAKFAVYPFIKERGRATAHLTNPDFATFSFLQDFCNGFTLLGSVSWTHWGLVQEVTQSIDDIPNIPGGAIHFNFHDTWRYGLALNYKPTEEWKLRMGLSYDQSATKFRHRTIQVPDANTVIMAFGANYKINKVFNMDAGYEHRFISSSSLAQTGPAAGPFENTVYADVKNSINVFGLQLNITCS